MRKFLASLGFSCVVVGLPIFFISQETHAQPANYMRIGGLNLNSHCQKHRGKSSYADLVERTASGWRCFVGTNRYSISVQNACTEQYRSYPVVFAYATNSRDPYSWGCFVPTGPLPR